MADTKISALVDGSSLQTTDEFVVRRLGSNVKITGQQLLNAAATFSASTLVQKIATTDPSYSASMGDFVSYDVTGSDATITLPDATAKALQVVIVKCLDSSGLHKVTVNTSISQTIDLQPSVYVFSGDSNTFVSNGANWLIM